MLANSDTDGDFSVESSGKILYRSNDWSVRSTLVAEEAILALCCLLSHTTIVLMSNSFRTLWLQRHNLGPVIPMKEKVSDITGPIMPALRILIYRGAACQSKKHNGKCQFLHHVTLLPILFFYFIGLQSSCVSKAARFWV